LIFLDTHIVVWLYAGLLEKISQPVQVLLNSKEMTISPIVRLELQYLYDIDRVTVQADAIIADLGNRIGLQLWAGDFNAVIGRALTLSWTRDPFDRLIAANASLTNDILISKDPRLHEHYLHTRW
jgi:PIN domain nuclease of toxin-antitoxin system